MNKHNVWLLLASAAVFSSCANPDNKTHPAKEKQDEIIFEKSSVLERTEDVYEIPTLKKLFVINRNGSHLYEKPEKSSTILASLEFGELIEVINETNEWYQIKERIGRSYISNGNQIETSGWEVVHIPKENAGLATQVYLTPEDLYKTTDKVQAKGKLQIDMISAGEFERAKQNQSNHIIQKTNLAQEKDSVLTITLNNGLKKKYVSTPSAEETMIVYTYLGHIDFLQAYILSLGYYEGGECKLYSTEDGTELASIIDNPSISPDRKHLISMSTDPYDNDTDLELHTIGTDRKIKQALQASFSSWMVSLEPQDIYWIDNSTFAFAVLHSKVFWDADGNSNKNYQYLKIKIL